MGTTPAPSMEGSDGQGLRGQTDVVDGALLEELWRECDPGSCGIERMEFAKILTDVGLAQNFGLAEGATASSREQAAFYRGLKLGDLVLARACAAGNERAWERFVAMYRQPLVSAAIAITGSESLGRELADQLYAELFGLTTRDGKRRCPLESYRGRGSLMGWLRTTLAQRHVDHYRRSHREEALDEYEAAALATEPGTPAGELTLLEKALESALQTCESEDRFLLAAYYLDEQTLQEIAGVLRVHEATVSRRLKRVCEGVRKQILKRLRESGMSRGAAEETLGADPRDLDLNLKKLLQCSQANAFEEKKAER